LDLFLATDEFGFTDWYATSDYWKIDGSLIASGGANAAAIGPVKGAGIRFGNGFQTTIISAAGGISVPVDTPSPTVPFPYTLALSKDGLNWIISF